MGLGAGERLRKGQAGGPQARRRSRRPGALRRGVPPEGRDGLRPDAGTLQGDAEEAGAGGQRGFAGAGRGQRPGEGTLQEPGGGAMGGDISRCAPRKPVQGAEGPQGNPPGGRVWGRPEAAPHGGEAAGPAGLCPPDLAGCSKRRGFCTGTCTKICGGGSNPLHFGSRYDKINVESCSAAYFFLHTKKPEGGRPPCEALL